MLIWVFLITLTSLTNGSVIHSLNRDNYVQTVSGGGDVPWLILFRSDKIIDMELQKALENLQDVGEETLHLGVVNCNEGFCEEGFFLFVCFFFFSHSSRRTKRVWNDDDSLAHHVSFGRVVRRNVLGVSCAGKFADRFRFCYV